MIKLFDPVSTWFPAGKTKKTPHNLQAQDAGSDWNHKNNTLLTLRKSSNNRSYLLSTYIMSFLI